MGCGTCGGKAPRAVAQTTPAEGGDWMYVAPDGKITKFQTQLAANAAKARQGGKGLVKRVQ
jgi:hypothetical protein